MCFGSLENSGFGKHRVERKHSEIVENNFIACCNISLVSWVERKHSEIVENNTMLENNALNCFSVERKHSEIVENNR